MPKRSALDRCKRWLGLLLEPRDSAQLPDPVPPAQDSSAHEFLLAEYDSLTKLVSVSFSQK